MIILGVTVLAAAALVHPRLSRARLWRATITPLASIIGSGFLVLGPILEGSYGLYAPGIMLALCAIAYLFGGAIRFNMARIGSETDQRPPAEARLESLASWTLCFAYVVSVAYYLNLFGAFGVSLTPVDDTFHARLLSSAVFILILLIGWTRGFSAMERLEQVSVGIKLSIIAGLLGGLVLFFARQTSAGELSFADPAVTPWAGLTLAFGLIVTVQGFETSRYLGETYDVRTRIRSMKLAQALATAIYMLYICLLAYALPSGTMSMDETAIIDAMQIVAPILPILLVVAALSAQLSAAVADTSGSGGLIAELTSGKVTTRQGYAVLVFAGLVMTWTTDVFEIISYASRAFALYYALQGAIAVLGAWRDRDPVRLALFGTATLLAMIIVLFGRSVE
ncbi:hypothetical protein [Palleronia sp. LCG004]|uniref:hypothetical protein n=1 Tax=Palleronia sp. LCG004 TaxID=3079304 RepID=UPI002943D834|nr:hypothetical protein [Palleronia sp. LCG004]WOI58348.1 hypothetical protein RVY76_17410 [Palleronia sp. LCG004]